MYPFSTPKAISDSLTRSKIYIGSRTADYESFCRDVKSRIAEAEIAVDAEFVVVFDNGYKATFRSTGDILLMKPGPESGKLFPTLEQFAAYYLAKFR